MLYSWIVRKHASNATESLNFDNTAYIAESIGPDPNAEYSYASVVPQTQSNGHTKQQQQPENHSNPGPRVGQDPEDELTLRENSCYHSND